MDITQKLIQLKQQQRYRTLKEVHHIEGKTIRLGERDYINFTSNDYLGLAQLPLDAENFTKSVKQYGNNLASSRLVSGNSMLYTEIEQLLSQYFDFEEAVIMNSGYDANLALFNAFKGEEMVAFSDSENHASIIDGLKLSRISKEIYRHLDYQDLARRLAAYPDTTKLIVTDSVFSTNGDLADIEYLVELKRQFPNTWLIVDDSHGLGLNYFDDYQNIDVITASLSKSVGAHGGVILCSQLFKELLVSTGRALIYSSGMPTSNLYFILRNTQAMLNEPYRKRHLKQLSRYFNTQLFSCLGKKCDLQTPIKSIELDDHDEAENYYQALMGAGILVSYFRYPTVSHPTLRFSLTYYHQKSDIDRLFQIILKQKEDEETDV
ncbi:aminotransferase class I/II-fold pyridoxal phosphate-dependent enzyme [Staphylococcus pettenkoferi]|uniref:aminotransferase class I/II-fold pyridoxal phosphate-dependent enzyme n=1 Tax=Staphylococcus pettenkoferi TaxID=170573 RepID=UPI00066C0ECB|nr:aminotransferase class I/II-fold pyridoxal phosphate-dependent enzyme [Staphylococcus pettenkoferi]MDK7114617.1 aminotransferase class I/II-fold pyridoxal phosphate-dependent enzyme [Staphylococcus pettenkoferi]MDK7283454.1 aminotransferase class I/II-fold pyridoxal phosphate-dependent enzyme [Staphylococcus pettenkoferi]